MNRESALGIVRLMIDQGVQHDDAISNPAIPVEFRDYIRETLDSEDNFILEPARIIVRDASRGEWINQCDRSTWYYWRTLREYLLGVRNWSRESVRSLDEVTNQILGQLEAPATEQFNVRGLVLGYVQSGKTANFTALIAKAADVGYRLVIVLSGIDNGLRFQTQVRLKRELVGYSDHRPNAVRMPPLGSQWHEFTRDDIASGDFQPGYANHAALQGSQPVLLVVKKNGQVLRRLRTWLDSAPDEIRRTIPLLVIDDEADQASVDTRGTFQEDNDPLPTDYEEPSVINGLIRDLLRRFQRHAYVAYTATPFANVLIPHNTFDRTVEHDLYPKDFIIDIPKPDGYFGAEELFGRFNPETGEPTGGLDVVREIPIEDLNDLKSGLFPSALKNAVLDFVLAGAGRRQRGQGDAPATMLIHDSQLTARHADIATLVKHYFTEFKDEWRYQREHGLREELHTRWESTFRPVTQASHIERDVSFDEIEPHIGVFIEAVEVRTINSETGEALDYDKEPRLKAIAIGGNRLSRGLTLEGLLVSFFARPSKMYDTLMQMGRWFGFRAGYDDLTRIWTTPELAGWFSDLAFVEYRLREDLRVYEEHGLKPSQIGPRIWQHPVMQVTSPLKRRFASTTTISQTYSGQLEQTFKFPLGRLDDLAIEAEANRQAVRRLFGSLDSPHWNGKGPVWRNVAPDDVVRFLSEYRQEGGAGRLSLPLICAYIERQAMVGELVRWTVAVRGLVSEDTRLGEADWGISDERKIWQISRTRIRYTDSVGVITGQGDELVGLSEEQIAIAERRVQESLDSGRRKSLNKAGREVRVPEEGLLLLYPISRHSIPERGDGNRCALYEDSHSPLARDLVGLAISFPESRQPQTVDAYMEGTAGWRPVE